MSQKLVEAAAREKTEKIISSELKKAANNPELHQRVQAIAPLSGVHSDDSALSTAVSVNYAMRFINLYLHIFHIMNNIIVHINKVQNVYKLYYF